MKKSFVLLLAFLIAAVVTGTVFGQTETITEVSWTDVAPMAAASGISGKFYSISETGLEMWIPDVFIEEELTDEDFENGFLVYMKTADESAFVNVTYFFVEGSTIDNYYETLAGMDEITELEYVIINGVMALSYTTPELDMSTISFVNDNGYVFEFNFLPISDEGFAQVATMMGASIRVAEE